MYHGGPAERCLLTLMGAFLLPLLVASGAVSGEWETGRSNYESALKANEKRIQEMEAKRRGIPDPQQRAEKITRDKVAAARAALKGGGTGKSLPEAAEKVSGDPKALAELSREQASTSTPRPATGAPTAPSGNECGTPPRPRRRISSA